MDFMTHGYFSLECTAAMNRAAAYKMHISNVYLALAYKFIDNEEMPPYAVFLDEQAEAHREQAKQLLRYLRRREGMVNLPVFKKPNLEDVKSPLQALELAMNMEATIMKILLDLKATASADGETDLLHLLAKFLFKQRRSEEDLECQISCQRVVLLREQQQKQPENLTEKPSTSGGNPDASGGNQGASGGNPDASGGNPVASGGNSDSSSG